MHSQFTFIKKNIHLFIYATLIILPSLLTGNTYTALYQTQSVSSILSDLSTLSTSIHHGLNDAQNYAAYSLNTLLRLRSFREFDLPEMGQHLIEFLYHHPTISNAYIIDANYTTLYGINDTNLSHAESTIHIESALNGSLGFYSTFIENIPFVQFAFPIFSDDTTLPPHAVLVITYDFSPLEVEFESLSSSFPGLHAHLFDNNGQLLISSINQSANGSILHVDIHSICQSITYAPSTPFELFDETPVVGKYYLLEDNDWVLLITSTLPDTLASTELISWLSGLFSLSSISFIELLSKKKKKSLQTLISETSIPVSHTSLPSSENILSDLTETLSDVLVSDKELLNSFIHLETDFSRSPEKQPPNKITPELPPTHPTD